MKKLRLLKLSFLIAILFGASSVFSQPIEEINPINILMDPVATDCGIYEVDLLVQQYIEISNISMTLDLGVLAPPPGPWAGITLHPAISATAIVYINAAGQLKISWAAPYDPVLQDQTSITLPDNTILFTMVFDVNGLWGTSVDLAWDDVLTIDCELSGPNANPIYPDYWNDLHWDIQDQLALSHTKTDFQCPDNPTGSIDLTVNGGVAPYTYAWTGTVVQPPNPAYVYPPFTGSDQEDLTGLYPGTYCVTVTDADFCVVAQYCVDINQIAHPGPREIGGPVPIASTIECAVEAVTPTLPVIEDECGTVLLPSGPTMDGTYVDCEGTITYTYVYTDYLNQTLTWTYTYTVEHSTPPAEYGGPVEIASTVECIDDAVAPTLPVVKDVCGVELFNPTLVEGGTYVDCEGTKTYTYTWTDCALLTYEWTYTYTIAHSTPPAEFGGPVEIASTVECIDDAVAPTLPVVKDICGVELLNPDLVEGGTYVDCEGTKTYTYTWTDCALLTYEWTYTYTIAHSTPPAEFGGPVEIASTVECIDDAVAPTLPVVKDICGVELLNPDLVEGGTYVDCEGTKTYTYTWTDCALLTYEWTYTYTIAHSTPPAEFGGPVEIASTVECIDDAVAPTLPVVKDVCGVELFNPTLVEGGTYVDCEGTKTYTYTWTDCALLTYEWTYTYTITHSTPPAEVVGPAPAPIASTVECAADAVEPAVLPVVEDVCGNVLPAPIPVMSSPVNCEGFITYTYTYTDCALLEFVWVYTYTIEHSTLPAEVGGPVETASTVECIGDAVAPGTVYQAGFAGDFDPINWTFYNTNGGDGSVDVSGAPASIILTGGDNFVASYAVYEITIPIDGTVAFNWDYTTIDIPGWDAFGYALDGFVTFLTATPGETGTASINVTQGTDFAFVVYTVDGQFGPGVSITDAFLFSSPAFPVVADVCGEILSPVGPIVTGTYDGCEGTQIYTYTYTDCANLDFVWAYTYTIEHSTPPAEFGGPVEIASTVECMDDAVAPTLPVVKDVCGVELFNPTLVEDETIVDCEGTKTYTYTWTDCAGLIFEWTYTYTIDDTQNPTITCPDNIEVFMDDGCTWILDEVVLGAPTVGDNCTLDPIYYNDAPANFPYGITPVIWTVEDCAGNIATCTQYVTVLYNTLSGKLVYNNIEPFGPDKILNNVELTLYNDAALTSAVDSYTTDFSGNYYFPDLCAGTYYVAITNNNKPAGGVNTTDAGQILVYYNNPYDIESVRWLAGNANPDNFINIADVGKTVNHFVYGDVIAPFDIYWNYYWAGEELTTNSPPSMPMSITIGPGNLGNLVNKIFGQCTGDFNGNFAPGVMKSASESLTLEYNENILVSSGSEFELPVYAGMDMEVGAISLIMNFPADEVEITNVFFTSDASAPLQYNIVGNELRISWYSLAPVWLNEGESLVTIKMKTSSEEGISFTLADSELNELADGNFKVIDNAFLEIDIPHTSPLGIGVNLSTEEVDFTSYPNPFKGTTTLTYSLPVDGQVLIEVYDLVGSKVKVVVDETQSAGEYSLKLDAIHMHPGVYTAILRLKTSDDKVTTRAIKMINR